jgi:hypothetical protein
MMGDSQREFLLVLRRALLLIIRWIEQRLGYGPPAKGRGRTLTGGGDP